MKSRVPYFGNECRTDSAGFT